MAFLCTYQYETSNKSITCYLYNFQHFLLVFQCEIINFYDWIFKLITHISGLVCYYVSDFMLGEREKEGNTTLGAGKRSKLDYSRRRCIVAVAIQWTRQTYTWVTSKCAWLYVTLETVICSHLSWSFKHEMRAFNILFALSATVDGRCFSWSQVQLHPVQSIFLKIAVPIPMDHCFPFIRSLVLI